ncbi:hypothetical protein GC088_05310 [Arthrobacter sp. JZ12]|uniref:hypothetical protein n=1 Tax=Arthrobacter sp. JZ12 TaxID=2654190 RepID=UPI002B496D2D|nr:hypothetical protein [Arthrobacter sp. JZ12]WRH24553.1 hypothetical protein GC088_05310 [Arthrobacter sp. JZ12]
MTRSSKPFLVNPASPFFGVLSTAVMGALPLIDPSKLTDADRQALHRATAVVTGTYVAVTTGANGWRLPLRIAAGLGAGALAWRFADVGEAFDSRIEEKLRSAGAQYPRAWMAVGAAAATFAGFLMDRAAARTAPIGAFPLVDAEEQVRPLTPEIRDLTMGILRAEETAGAAELLAQLDTAEEVHWGEGRVSSVHFRMREELPKAVPHDQIFPVRARFSTLDGIPLEVVLHVTDGMLDCLVIEYADSEEADGVAQLEDVWPDPSEVVFVVDGPEGKTAVTAG